MKSNIAIVLLLLVAFQPNLLSKEKLSKWFHGTGSSTESQPTEKDSYRYYAGVFKGLADCLQDSRAPQPKTYYQLDKLLMTIGDLSNSSEPTPVSMKIKIKESFGFIHDKKGDISPDDKLQVIQRCKELSEGFLNSAQ